MYLTRMELDTDKRNTKKALISPNLLHGAIEASFSGERKRRLWRVEKFQNRYFLLLLSSQPPDLFHAARQFGFEDKETAWQTKSYDPLMKKIQNNSIWQFRLTANPTKSVKPSQRGERGTVHAHITPKYQLKWLLDRCEAHGFAVESDEVCVTESQWLRFYKGKERRRPVSILSVTFDGILKVTDEECFCQTLKEGIGRGKAFGMGLLTVMRPMGHL